MHCSVWGTSCQIHSNQCRAKRHKQSDANKQKLLFFFGVCVVSATSGPGVSLPIACVGKKRAMETAPPMLVWLLQHLCICNGEDVYISKTNVEKVARVALNSGNDSNTRFVTTRMFEEFFHSETAELFAVKPEHDACAVFSSETYILDVLLVLLDHFGISMPIDAWKSAVACVVEFSRKMASTTFESAQVSGPYVFSNATSLGAFHANGVEDVDMCSNPMDVHDDFRPSSSWSRTSTSGSLASDTGSGLWFESLTHEELLAKLHERDNKIQELQDQVQQLSKPGSGCGRNSGQKKLTRLRTALAAAKKTCRTLSKENMSVKKSHATLAKRCSALEAMQIKRNGKRSKKKMTESPDDQGEDINDHGWLLPAGICQLAIKRNLSHCSSEHLQLLVQQDISRWTVSSFSGLIQLFVHKFISP